MNSGLTIVYLVSDQTLQNVLPILALKPSRAIAVLSTEKFSVQAGFVESSVREAARCGTGFRFPVQFDRPVTIGYTSPTIQQTQNALTELMSRSAGLVVNYTGGTKEMSIGAWLAAHQAGRASLYCDTPREFRSGGTGPISFTIQLPELAKALRVEILLAAHGLVNGRDWKESHLSRQRLSLGTVSFDLHQKHPRSFTHYRQQIREHGISGHKRKPNQDDLQRARSGPLPKPPLTEFNAFLDAALNCQLLRKKGDDYFFNLSQQAKFKEACQRLMRLVTQLDGGAFEGYTEACLQKSTRFSHVLHGVMPAGALDEAGFGETDFLAYDPGALSLTLISCKSTPPSLEHLEAMLARKDKLGGRFARGILCVQSAGQSQETSLRRLLARLGLECAIGPEIEKVLAVSAPVSDGVAWAEDSAA